MTSFLHFGAALLLLGVAAAPCLAETAANLAALRGLVPASALGSSLAGRSLLLENFGITMRIQAGTVLAPSRLSLGEQRQQALRDAFITGWNGAGVADGLGTALSGAYEARASYRDPNHFSSISPAVATLIAYTNETTGADSNFAKYAFANGTRDGTHAISAEAAAVLARAGGTTDFMGKAYGRLGGGPGADPFGNSRPFQTGPAPVPIEGADYFGKTASNLSYLVGPDQDLVASPSFPSGHTTYGTVEAVLLGILVPERYAQQVMRAGEYGHDRIILGAHYATDVIAGRALALHDLAHLLANDRDYVGQPRARAAVVTDFAQAVVEARADLVAALEAGCGHSVAVCAGMDEGRFADAATNTAASAFMQTYGLPVVYEATVGAEDVNRLAPEAGHLLTAAFPYLTLEQANAILTATEGPGGRFLDDGSGFGIYARINLLAAVQQAAAMRPR